MAPDLAGASQRSRFRRRCLASAIEDFESACLTGTTGEIERARCDVLFVAVSLLAHLKVQAEEILKFWGIDPAARP